MIAPERFAQYVKDALANLYDPAHLETHPLLDLLVPQSAPTETLGLSLRELLLQATERLRPMAHIPFSHPEWLGYRIMQQRYIEGLHPTAICQKLNLAHTTFYRYHHEALEAVTNILWERCQQAGSLGESGRGPSATPVIGVSPEAAREEASAVASIARRQWVAWTDVLNTALHTIQPFAQQEGITLCVEAPAALPSIYADPATLHQILCNVLSEAIPLSTDGVLRLDVAVEARDIRFQLYGLDTLRDDPQALDRVPGLAVARGLLDAYGGSLCFGAAPESGLLFTVPVGRPQTILLIDDSAEVANLYRRYLQTRNYVMTLASDAGAVRRCLATMVPDLILLDVLMPDEDGWRLLQMLRTLPETSRIPVVVCSILSQPGLALALGAQAVLQKPVKQEDLLETLEALLHPVDSRAPQP